MNPYIGARWRRRAVGRGLVQTMIVAAMLFSWLERAGAQVGVWSTIGPTGGAISALLASPTSASTLYAGTPENGVFVSTDAGATWSVANSGIKPSTDVGRQTLYAIRALVTDGQYLYAATGSGMYFALANGSPSWSAMAGPWTIAPSLLAFDPATRRLFAAARTTDPAAVPTIYIASVSGSSPPVTSWSAAPLPSAPGTPIGALAIAPSQGSLSPATLMAGVGVNLYTAPVAPSSPTLSWVDGDPSAVLQGSGAVSAVSFSPDFLQAYACAGGPLFYSGNPFDAQPVWLVASVAVTGATLFNCNAIASVSMATGGAPAVVLGTDQGAFVSVDGINFAATSSLGAGSAANAFAVGSAAGSTTPTLYVGADAGVEKTNALALASSVTWTASNGPLSLNLGGSSLRLNNVDVLDTAVLGTTIYAAAFAGDYAEVFASSDSGATWTPTQVASALNAGEQIIALAADPPNSVLYAATTQGLLAYTRSTGSWVAIGVAGMAGRVGAVAVGTSTLFAGTDNGVFALPLSAAPSGAVPISAGLAGSSVRSLLVSDSSVYAGTIDAMDNNFVFTTTEASAANGTAVWSAYGVGSAGTNRITSLLRANGNLLAATNGSLILVASAGSAWSSANTSSDPLQQISDTFGAVYSLYSDGTSIYAATGSNGVFVSPMGSAFSWVPLSGAGTSALPSSEVHSLRGNGSTLYAATAAGIATSSNPTTVTPVPVAQAPAPSSNSGGGATDELFAGLILASALAVRRWRRS